MYGAGRYVGGVEPIQAVRWSPSGDALRIIDQRRLPGEYVERDMDTIDDVVDAIATLAVRGAPAIGVAAAIGLVASLDKFGGEELTAFRARLQRAARRLSRARPTAVNLGWAMSRMMDRAEAMRDAPNTPALLAELRLEATRILEEDRAMCAAIGAHGLSIVRDMKPGTYVLTHCNAGALATAGIGTGARAGVCGTCNRS